MYHFLAKMNDPLKFDKVEERGWYKVGGTRWVVQGRWYKVGGTRWVVQTRQVHTYYIAIQ